MSAPSPHLDVQEAADLAEGLLEQAEADAARAHLESCADCRGVRDRLTRLQAVLAAEGADRPALPAAVAERIDAALAAERQRPERSRTPSRWPRVLVAAASVAVVGAAVVYGLDQPDGSGSNDAATAGQASRTLPESAAGPGAAEEAPPTFQEGGGAGGQALALDGDRLAASVRRALREARSQPGFTVGQRGVRGEDACLERALGPREGGGALFYPARIDGRRVTLVVQPAKTRNRMAFVVDCSGRPRTLASTPLP